MKNGQVAEKARRVDGKRARKPRDVRRRAERRAKEAARQA